MSSGFPGKAVTVNEFISFAREFLSADETGKDADTRTRIASPTARELVSLAWEALRGREAAEIETGTKAGKTAAALMERLALERPDVHARVLAGELTPHAGLVEAGLRKKTVRRKHTPFERAQRLVAKLNEAERHQLWNDLGKEFREIRRSQRRSATPLSGL